MKDFVDAGGNYQLITGVGIQTMFSIYCTLGKWFDADCIKNMFEFFFKVSDNFNALEELLSNSSRSTYSQPSHVSTPTAHV